jgi:hypothetical protein
VATRHSDCKLLHAATALLGGCIYLAVCNVKKRAVKRNVCIVSIKDCNGKHLVIK